MVLDSINFSYYINIGCCIFLSSQSPGQGLVLKHTATELRSGSVNHGTPEGKPPALGFPGGGVR